MKKEEDLYVQETEAEIREYWTNLQRPTKQEGSEKDEYNKSKR